MVPRDDHDRVFQEFLAKEFAHQAAELIVQRRDAIVVAIAGHAQVSVPIGIIVFHPEVEQKPVNRQGAAVRSQIGPNTWAGARRGYGHRSNLERRKRDVSAAWS